MFRITNISNRQEVTQYLNEVGQKFCPFLSPSMNDGLMLFTEYDVDGHSFNETQEFLFYSALIHTYAFRKSRETERNHKKRLLLCENLIYNLGEGINGEKAFAFPHWFLKLLFTEKSILFGKFWKGEILVTRDDIPITVPPIHFFSIRSAIKPTDKRFFTITPELTEFYLKSEDDNLSVFHFIKDKSTIKLLKESENFDFDKKSKESVSDLIENLMNSKLYTEVAKWASDKETELGLENYSSSQTKD